jgi:hypothetical protein
MQLTYFNKDWCSGDGGELVLQPFLDRETIIRPLHDRAVFFLSDRLLHRVLPSRPDRVRYASTTWFDGAAVNQPAALGLRLPPSAQHDAPATAELLRLSPCQRALSRAVYAEEYEASLRECMQGTDGEAQMLAAHALFLSEAEQNAPLWRLICALRTLKALQPPSRVV